MSEVQKMDPEVKKLWVEALRSGKYEQGQFALRDKENRYCCLGVLCDLLKEQVGGGWFPGKLHVANFWIGDLRHSIDLPATVARKAQLFHENQLCLIRMNDFEKKSFEQIAEYIEENL